VHGGVAVGMEDDNGNDPVAPSRVIGRRRSDAASPPRRMAANAEATSLAAPQATPEWTPAAA